MHQHYSYEHIALGFAILQNGCQLFSTWLISWIPTPPEIDEKWYNILYNVIERMSWGKQREWKKPNGTSSDASNPKGTLLK